MTIRKKVDLLRILDIDLCLGLVMALGGAMIENGRFRTLQTPSGGLDRVGINAPMFIPLKNPSNIYSTGQPKPTSRTPDGMHQYF